jgi:beta-glucosidase
VTNTGRRAGDEVVQLCTRRRDSHVAQPLKTLRAFARVHLQPAETRDVPLSFTTSALAIWDVTRDRWALERGVVGVLAGGASDELPARTALYVRGETIPPRDLSRDTQAQDYDGRHGTTLTDETKAAGTAVTATAGGAWLRFADSNLRRPARIVARVSAAAAGTVVVRFDDPARGRVIGTLPVPATGDRYAWTTVAAPLSGASGRHDVYLMLTAPLSLSRFRLGYGRRAPRP